MKRVEIWDILRRSFISAKRSNRRNYEIDDSLYVRLEQLSTVYDATITDLVNASLEHLIESEKISLYKKADNDFFCDAYASDS